MQPFQMQQPVAQVVHAQMPIPVAQAPMQPVMQAAPVMMGTPMPQAQPMGNRFDPRTGKPLPKFDPRTGQQTW